ncbi:PAS domain S-box protein [Cyanobium sp. FGCU-6]|nr:PAS domain S-box protein [Cyanobium sp. FGCU6]
MQQAMSHAAIGTALLNAEGRFLEVNPALCHMLGRDEAELRGLSLQEVTHPDDLAENLQRVAEIVSGEREAFQRELRYLHVDGQPIWGQVSMSCLRRGADGLVIVQIVNNTEAVRQRQALADHDHHYRLLADNVLDVVWSIDLEGRFTFLSPSVQRLRGFTPDEVMAMPLEANFTPESFRFVVAGLEQARRAAQEGRPVSFEAELEEICKDGTTVRTEVRATSLFDEQGRFVEIVGTTRNISAQHRLREELRISEERYRLLAENARDVIWTMDPDGTISYVSPSIELLRGFTPEEAMAQPLEQMHPPESQERFRRFFRELLDDTAKGRPAPSFRGELDYLCRDGTTIWAEVIALPVIDAQGRFEKLLGISRDISERKDFEQQLLKANQQLEQLAITDWLTGLWNRGHLESQIQQAIARSERYGEPLSLILCDLDHFKTINDRFGHVSGDEVLREFCRRIRMQLRRSDGFGRWGGEEFLILLPCSDATAAGALARKLQKAISATPFDPVGTVTCSFGVAERRSGEPEDEWLLRVDNQLDAAKTRGRNSVVVA